VEYEEEQEQEQEHDPMNAPHEPWFDHEKLVVYREAVLFVAWLSSPKGSCECLSA